MTKNISVVIVDNINHELSKFAIEKTLETIDCCEVLTFSDRPIISGATFIPIKKQINLYDYSQFILKNLWAHVETDHILIIQWDGMATTSNLWDDDFLKYDYVGAIWPWPQQGINMGNGGFSLRSRKLIESLRDSKINLGPISGQNEDIAICVEHRDFLQNQYGIKYAPDNVARQFSTENEWLGKSFGFHGIWNAPRFLSELEVEYIINNIKPHFWADTSKVIALVNSLNKYNLPYLAELCINKS